MINESYPWKQDLLRRRRNIKLYNTTDRFEHDFESTCSIMETAVMYSAFAIRKLLDCKCIISDQGDSYSLNVHKYKPIRFIDQFHKTIDDKSHNLSDVENTVLNGKDICNKLIHSYLFDFGFCEEGFVDCFFVSSDRDRNKDLYCVQLSDWLNYIDFIATDCVVAIDASYSEEKSDYIIKNKKRGKY